MVPLHPPVPIPVPVRVPVRLPILARRQSIQALALSTLERRHRESPLRLQVMTFLVSLRCLLILLQHYWDGQKGACGCGTGTGGGNLFPWQQSPGPGLFTAAASQNLFDGEGSTGSYCGTGCGQCYNVTNLGYIAAQGQGDCTGVGESITVMTTNLCPANGNQQWCAQPTNEYDFPAHFDIMQASSSAGGPMGWSKSLTSRTKILLSKWLS